MSTNTKLESDTIADTTTNSAPTRQNSQDVIIYWDHDSIPVPNGCTVEQITQRVKKCIWDKIGSKLIHFRLYTSCKTLHVKIQEALYLNDIQHIHIEPNHQNTSKCALRLCTDIALKLFELEQNKTSKCIALMSDDDDYAHLLSRIHKQRPISHLLYVTLGATNPHFISNVDFVIQCNICTTHDNKSSDIAINTNNVRKRQRDSIADRIALPSHKKQRVEKDNNDIKICVTFKRMGTNCEIKLSFCMRKQIKKVRNALYHALHGSGKIGKKQKKPFLVFNGKRMSNGKTLSFYDVNDGDIVHWYKTRNIKVYHRKSSKYSKCNKVVNITTADTVSVSSLIEAVLEKLKNVLKERNIKKTFIVLFRKGCEMDKNKTILEYNYFGSLEWDYDDKYHDTNNTLRTNTQQIQVIETYCNPKHEMPSLEKSRDRNLDLNIGNHVETYTNTKNEMPILEKGSDSENN